MSLLNRALEKKGYLVLDGGLATTLEQDGHVLDKDLWSGYTAINCPLSIVSVHERFLNAGSDVIITSSYQLSYEGLRRKGLCKDMYDMSDPANRSLRATTAYAIAARENIPIYDRNASLIASSVGCFGAHLGDGSEYTGCYGVNVKKIEEWHAQRYQVLRNSGPDLMAFETIPCIDECKALCSLISRYDLEKGISGWMSFACKGDGKLNSGEDFEDAIRVVLDPVEECISLKYIGIGVNCTSPNFINELLDITSNYVTPNSLHPVVVYPNKGELWDDRGRVWVQDTAVDDSAFAQSGAHDWYERGARIIGGCCRTTPCTIRKLSAALKIHL